MKDFDENFTKMHAFDINFCVFQAGFFAPGIVTGTIVYFAIGVIGKLFQKSENVDESNQQMRPQGAFFDCLHQNFHFFEMIKVRSWCPSSLRKRPPTLARRIP